MVKPHDCQRCAKLAECWPVTKELTDRLTAEDMRHEIHLRGMARLRADLLRAKRYVITTMGEK